MIDLKFLIVDELICGIDVGMKVEVYCFIFELVGCGIVILMILLELFEVFGMVDMVLVMYEGCILVMLFCVEVIVEFVMYVVSVMEVVV